MALYYHQRLILLSVIIPHYHSPPSLLSTDSVLIITHLSDSRCALCADTVLARLTSTCSFLVLLCSVFWGAGELVLALPLTRRSRFTSTSRSTLCLSVCAGIKLYAFGTSTQFPVWSNQSFTEK